MAQTRSLTVPEELYQRLARLAEIDPEKPNSKRSEQRIVQLIAQALDGLGRGAAPPLTKLTSQDVSVITHAAKKAPMVDIARLARPDGETRHVAFRLAESTAAWLDETQQILSMLPTMSAFYGNIDRSTAIRHTLAHALLLELPLDSPPPRGGDTVSVHLPQALFDMLESKIAPLQTKGARTNTGVSTVIRYVLAAAQERQYSS